MKVSAVATDPRLSASSNDGFAPRHSVNYAFVAKSPFSSHPDSSRPPRDEGLMNSPGHPVCRVQSGADMKHCLSVLIVALIALPIFAQTEEGPATAKGVSVDTTGKGYSAAYLIEPVTRRVL